MNFFSWFYANPCWRKNPIDLKKSICSLKVIVFQHFKYIQRYNLWINLCVGSSSQPFMNAQTRSLVCAKNWSDTNNSFAHCTPYSCNTVICWPLWRVGNGAEEANSCNDFVWVCSVPCPLQLLWMICHEGKRCHSVFLLGESPTCASSTEISLISGAESWPWWLCAPFPCISRCSWPIRVGDQICLEHVESFHITKLAWKWELAVTVIYYHSTEGWLPVRFVSGVFFHRHVCPYCKLLHPKWHQLCLPRRSWISPRDSLIRQKLEPSHARRTAGWGNCAF